MENTEKEVVQTKKKANPALYKKTVDAQWGGLTHELELAAEVGKHLYLGGKLVFTNKKGPNGTIVKSARLK